MEYLVHHGIKGMHWGVRRYQNKDGTLTAEGKEKYGTTENFERSRNNRKQTIKKVAVGTAVAAAILATGIAAYKINNKKQTSNIKVVSSSPESKLKRFAKETINNPTNKKAKSFTEKMSIGQKTVTIMKDKGKISVNYDGTDFKKKDDKISRELRDLGFSNMEDYKKTVKAINDARRSSIKRNQKTAYDNAKKIEKIVSDVDDITAELLKKNNRMLGL